MWKQIENYKTTFQQVRELDGQQGQPTLTGIIDELARDDKVVGFQPAMGQANYRAINIPDLEIANLPLIAKALVELHPCQRDAVASQLRERAFLKKLADMFHMLEDVEDQESLHHVNNIMKTLVMLNDPGTLEVLFGDEMMMDTIGMLEYDSSFPEKQNHRKILKSQISFKEVVPIEREEVLSKIHQTFKISYIKDTILPIVLDDATFGTLSSIILYNNIEILQALAQDSKFFSTLFDKMKNVERKTPDWTNLVEFLQEICDHAKHLQLQQRHQLFVSLIKLGLFDVTCSILQDEDDSIRLKGMDVMMSTLQHDPSSLRSFLMQQENKENSTLLKTMIDTLMLESESGLQEQMCDVLRMLLDPESIQPNVKERSEFWDLFYQKYFWQVINMLTEDSTSTTLVLILDLLCFCVHVHAMWIKYFTMRNKMIDKVAKLLYRKEKVVVLAALRLLRTCVGLKEEFYTTQIINNNAFAPVIDVFLANGERYNMLNSAVLELFIFIKKDNLKSLISYTIEKFWERLSSIEYVPHFKDLKQKHEENVNTEAKRVEGEDKTAMAVIKLNHMRKRRDGSMDKEEEDYFDSDIDGDENNEASAMKAMKINTTESTPNGLPGSSRMIMDPDSASRDQPKFPASRLAGSVVLNSSSPLVLNPLVDYDIDDASSPHRQTNNLYTSSAPGLAQVPASSTVNTNQKSE